MTQTLGRPRHTPLPVVAQRRSRARAAHSASVCSIPCEWSCEMSKRADRAHRVVDDELTAARRDPRCWPEIEGLAKRHPRPPHRGRADTAAAGRGCTPRRCFVKDSGQRGVGSDALGGDRHASSQIHRHRRPLDPPYCRRSRARSGTGRGPHPCHLGRPQPCRCELPRRQVPDPDPGREPKRVRGCGCGRRRRVADALPRRAIASASCRRPSTSSRRVRRPSI